MRLPKLLLAIALLGPARVFAQEPEQPPRTVTDPAATLQWPGAVDAEAVRALFAMPGWAEAWRPDRGVDAPWAFDPHLAFHAVPALRGPRGALTGGIPGGLAGMLPGGLPLAGLPLPGLPLPGLRISAPRLPRTARADPDTASAPVEERGLFRDLEIPDVLSENADLALRVEGRGELGGLWNRYRPCEPGLRLNCNPDLLPQLRPEIQFGVQVGGTISDRLHVDVDYDQRREFDAANNINIYYQGMPGEVLQRLEMGDVSVDLPASRYLTQGIPVGNFGFKAAARLGETDVEAVWAQQKGDIAAREFRLGGGAEGGLVQDQELVIDDADYVTGQFFFLVDPSRLVGAPHIDILTVDRTAAPPDARPLAEGLVVYRDEGAMTSMVRDQAQTGKFLADAVSEDGLARHSGLFTLLEPGQDYFVHSSGLWLALRAPLRGDEALAVAYVTETGDTVGDPTAEQTIGTDKPELRLVRGPVTIHQPGQSTWPWEMHQVYRLDSSADVETSSLELTISLGHMAGGATFRQFMGRQIPLLRLFGLDDDAPADRVDAAHIFRPGADGEGFNATALRGTFIVFPTLEPFGRPPPVPSEGLTADQSAAALGTDANPDIYDEPDPVVRTSSSRYRLNFDYRVRLDGVPSSFNLGAFGIRQGTERITVDDRLLVRGVDYVLDYDLGLVTLLDPLGVLGSNPDAEIRATWEQNALFDVAPTTVFGLTSRSRLGDYGDLSFIGMYQSEQSIVRRPQLGTAPGAVLLGGASGRLAFQADWMREVLEGIPALAVDSTARLDVTGELALSAPDPNRQGATYLDDFEATDHTPLSLDAVNWQLGSAPQNPVGMDLPFPADTGSAARLVWQDRYLEGDREVGFLTANEIDQQIAFAGAQLAERVLYLTMSPRAGATAPQWRSLTTALSTTGRDLSRSEFLEFYTSALDPSMEGATLIIDVGTVSEDAYYIAEDGSLEGTAENSRPWGQGVLDEEARLALREVWGPGADSRGLWDQTCQAERLRAVPLGDPAANCTVNNGRPDTEDLNANGVLDDLDGPHFRYVVRLDGSSEYLVRDRNATGTGFQLYRIPLRGTGAEAVGQAGDATWRFVKHLRVTVVQPNRTTGTLALARFRIAGSRWTKREVHGVLSGLIGDQPGVGSGSTQLRVGPVSKLTDGAAYSSPPGVEDEVQDPKSAIGASGVEFNEKSLRLAWDALPSGERAEVYYRYPQQPRNFLEYRSLRFWAVARSGSWGEGGDHRLLVKLGTDDRNYYLFQSPLRPSMGGGGVAEADWLPERVISFETWFRLKAEAERLLIENGGTSGTGEPLVVWNADSTHAVVLEDRARAPNLAAVRELGFAVYNAGAGDAAGEVWLDDLRLDAGAREVGFAGRLDMDLDAGGFLSAGLSFGGRGGRFRQLDDFATYQSSDDLSVSATAELGRFAPAEWGLAMPLSVSYLRTSHDPIFLQGTDVRASRLEGLRESGSARRRVSVSLRKTTPSSNPLVAALVDGTSLRLGYVSARDGTVTTSSRLSGVDGGLEFDRRVPRVDMGLLPDFLQEALRWLAPTRVEDSEFFRRLTGARLRLTPERVGFSASYASQDSRVWRYERPLEGPDDDDVQPLDSPRRGMEGAARLTLRPFESLTVQGRLLSGRDLLEPERSTPLPLERQAMRNARTELAGVPLGWERDRTVSTDVSYRPVIADWLRPSVVWNTRFGQRRDPAHLHPAGSDGTDAVLARTFNADRRVTRGLVVDPAAALRAAFLPEPTIDPADPGPHDPGAGASAGASPSPGAGATPGGIAGALLGALDRLKPVDLTWTDELASRFDRDLAEPGWGYQLGWGDPGPFRFIGGDTAITAHRRDAFRARSGLRLGSTASLDVGYGTSDHRAVDLRAGTRRQLERTWPEVQLSWQQAPVPGWLERVVDRWSFSTGYVNTLRTTTLGVTDPRIRGQEERTIPVEARLGFAGGLSLSYLGTFTDGDGRDPTGTTAQEAVTHGVDLSGRFTAPGALRQRLSDPLRLSLAYDYQAQRHCRDSETFVATGCTPFIDFMNRRLNLTLSALVSRMDIGLQVGYVDRRNFIGTQAGSSQLQIGLFGQFNIQAGTF